MYQNGAKVYTLSQLVDRFNIKQGNDKQRFYPRMLLFAQFIFIDLFQNTIWTIKQVALPVCHGRVTLPSECQKFLSIGIVDQCNKVHGLTYNPNINTLEMKCLTNRCSCERCRDSGGDTLCDVQDNLTVTTEAVTLHGVDYTKTIYSRIDREGNVTTHEHTPAWDVATNAVIYVDTQETVTALELDKRGCVRNNESNVHKLKDRCGLNIPLGYWESRGWDKQLTPADINYHGYWNWVADSQREIEVFGEVNRVVVSYQVATESEANIGAEMVVPDYAEFCVNTGMIWQQRTFDPKDRDRDGTGLNAYRREQLKVQKYLMPVRAEVLQMLNTRRRLW